MGSLFRALLLGPLISKFGTRKMGLLAVQPNRKDLGSVTQLASDGKLEAVIDRCYPLSEVAEALRYLGAGHARGKVVVRVAAGGPPLPPRP